MTDAAAPIDLSLCIPTFNRAHLLRGMLRSLDVALQRAPNLRCEVVIRDNASRDDTAVVIKWFASRHITSYSRNAENIGAIRNLLSVVKDARGRYCWMLGDDDLVVPDGLERIADAIAADGHFDSYIVSHAIERDNERPRIEADLFAGMTPEFDRTLIRQDVTLRSLSRFEYVFQLSDIVAPLNFMSNLVFRTAQWQLVAEKYLQHCERTEPFSDAITTAAHTCIWGELYCGKPVGLVPEPVVVGFVGEQAFLSNWPVMVFSHFLEMSQRYLAYGADPAAVVGYQRKIYSNAGSLGRLVVAMDPYAKRFFSLKRLIGDYGHDPALWQALSGAGRRLKSRKQRVSLWWRVWAAAVRNPRSMRGLYLWSRSSHRLWGPRTERVPVGGGSC